MRSLSSSLMFRAFAVLLLAVALASGESDQTTLRHLWASHAYKPKPIPDVWRLSTTPPTERDLDAFRRFTSRVFAVSAFISHFGVPDRYLVTSQRDQSDFLIYDLPAGATVALYVSKPPHDSFGAAVIIDARGKLIRLIK